MNTIKEDTEMTRKSLATALALTVSPLAAMPAHAGVLDSIYNMFQSSGGGTGGMSAQGATNQAEIQARRTAAAAAAAEVGELPALFGGQIMFEMPELQMATEQHFLTNQGTDQNWAPAAAETGGAVRAELGSQGVSYDRDAALGQRQATYLDKVPDPTDRAQVTARQQGIIDLNGAGLMEAAGLVAQSRDASERDSRTAQDIVAIAQNAVGPTQAMQANVQMGALSVEKMNQII